MNEFQEKAVERLDAELKNGTFDRIASIMKKGVHDALVDFCRQDYEFAQAVVQGGTFTDCMKAVAKNCGHGISDLDAYRRAVQFYFPGAEIEFQMAIYLCEAEKPKEEADAVIVNFDDFWK